jgi:hypothetical protein
MEPRPCDGEPTVIVQRLPGYLNRTRGPNFCSAICAADVSAVAATLFMS